MSNDRAKHDAANEAVAIAMDDAHEQARENNEWLTKGAIAEIESDLFEIWWAADARGDDMDGDRLWDAMFECAMQGACRLGRPNEEA